MKDPRDHRHDLTFVDPDKREKVRRRIEEIEAFIASPGRKAAETAAQRLGLSVTQFYRIVKVWRKNPTPEKIADARRGMSKPRGVNPRVVEILGATAQHNPNVPATTVGRLAAAAIVAEGLAVPSDDTIRSVIQAMRRETSAGTPAGVGLSLDFCRIDIPVARGDAERLPAVAMVIDLESREFVGLALAAEPGVQLAARALIDAAENSKCVGVQSASIPLKLDITAGHGWQELLAALEPGPLRRFGRKTDEIVGSQTATRIMGRTLAGFKLSVQLWGQHALAGRRSSTMSMADAEAMLRNRMRYTTVTGGALARLTVADAHDLGLALHRFVERLDCFDQG